VLINELNHLRAAILASQVPAGALPGLQTLAAKLQAFVLQVQGAPESEAVQAPQDGAGQ